MPDFMTRLRAFERPEQRMAKTLRDDGTWSDYGRSKNFKVYREDVSNIDELYGLLEAMALDPWLCAIRGDVRAGITPETSPELFHQTKPEYANRSLQVFRDAPHHWMCVDVDHFESDTPLTEDPAAAVQEAVEGLLPPEFHGASYVWQLSNRAGFVPGVKAHIWFWLAEKHSSVVLKNWAARFAPGIDTALFNPVQVHYTAEPVIEQDVEDPCPQRIGLVRGMLSDEVDLQVPENIVELDELIDLDANGTGCPPDPREKGNYVGAFCRAWPIDRVLDELLSDVFVPQDDRPNRLTYLLAEGGGAGGAFITADGLHIVNKHNSDPFFNRAANAFDLVRYYLHDGDRDDDKKPVNQRASYQAMTEWCEADEDTATEIGKIPGLERVHAEDEFEPLDDEALPGEFDDEHERVEALIARKVSFMESVQHSEAYSGQSAFEVWQGDRIPEDPKHLFNTDKNGNIKPTLNNTTMVMAVDPMLRRCMGFDEFGKRRGLYGPLPWRGAGVITPMNPDVFTDSDYSVLRGYIEERYGFVPTQDMVQAAIDTVTKWANFHPVKASLQALEWDGVARLDSWLVDYCNVEDSEYTRAVGARTLIGAVKRIFEPGCKHDTVLVLEGRQGFMKSTAVEVLAGNRAWYREGVADIADQKKLVEDIRGRWFVELPELSALSRATINEAKEAITRSYDQARMAYAREETTLPRQAIFVGSTNNQDYLRDATGNRRFWPAEVTAPIAIDDLRAARDQLMAEAVHRYHAGERNYIGMDEPELMLAVEEAQNARYEESDEEQRIYNWLEGAIEGELFEAEDDETRDAQGRKTQVSSREILAECFGRQAHALDQVTSRRLKGAIKRFFARSPDWSSRTKQIRTQTGAREYVYERVTAEKTLH